MSGAIVIEGIERYVPEVRYLPERVMVVRGLSLESDSRAEALKEKVGIRTAKCGASSGTPNEIFTVNGAIRPTIEIEPGEANFGASLTRLQIVIWTCKWIKAGLKLSPLTECPLHTMNLRTQSSLRITCWSHPLGVSKPLLPVPLPALTLHCELCAWTRVLMVIPIRKWSWQTWDRQVLEEGRSPERKSMSIRDRRYTNRSMLRL